MRAVVEQKMRARALYNGEVHYSRVLAPQVARSAANANNVYVYVNRVFVARTSAN